MTGAHFSERFVEQHPFEEGFAAVFERTVLPELGRIGQSRRDGGSGWPPRLMSLALARAAIWGLSLVVFAPGSPLGVVIAVALTIVAVDLLLRRGDRAPGRREPSLRDILIRAACEHLDGLSYQRVPGRRVEFDRFAELGLVPAFETALVEDLFTGRHRDAGFRMIEAELRSAAAGTVFHGLLFEIEVPVAFSGRTVVANRHDADGKLLPQPHSALRSPPGQPVRLHGHPAFERRFDVLAEDEREAKALLTVSLRTSLVRLAEDFPDAAWQAGFAYGQMLIAMPAAGELFEPASARTGRPDPVADARRLLAEIAIAYRIVDTLHGIDFDTGTRLRAR